MIYKIILGSSNSKKRVLFLHSFFFTIQGRYMKPGFGVWVILFLSFCSSNLFSQGIFLEKGEAGFFANGGYTKFKTGSGTSIGGGAALGGVFEFDFSSTNSKIKLSKYGLGNEIEVNSKTASFGVVLLKRKAQLELNIGFTTSNESSDSYKSSDALLLGFNVGSEIKLAELLSWYPIFSFAVGISLEENSGNPVTVLGLSSPILIAEHVYLGPSFALTEGDLNWGFTAGVLVSFNIDNAGGW